MEANLTDTIPLRGLYLAGALIFILLYVAFTLITIYHWRAFANDEQVAKRTIRWYLISTVSLLSIALITFIVSHFI